jgi:hypothetical protein
MKLNLVYDWWVFTKPINPLKIHNLEITDADRLRKAEIFSVFHAFPGGFQTCQFFWDVRVVDEVEVDITIPVLAFTPKNTPSTRHSRKECLKPTQVPTPLKAF